MVHSGSRFLWEELTELPFLVRASEGCGKVILSLFRPRWYPSQVPSPFPKLWSQVLSEGYPTICSHVPSGVGYPRTWYPSPRPPPPPSQDWGTPPPCQGWGTLRPSGTGYPQEDFPVEQVHLHVEFTESVFGYYLHCVFFNSSLNT